MHYRLVAQLSKRGADPGEVCFEGKAERQVAVLYQNDDYGKDYLKCLKDGLGAKAASMIVAEDAYEVAEPTIDSQAVNMKSLNADVFVDITTPKFTAQAIRKAAEIGWKPLHVLNSVSTSMGAVINPPVSKTHRASFR
ncbi:ABC-type branched-subunit amino acid transport system substrate-binding protein [Bradyrhizobium sp. LA7.1]